MNNLHKSIVWYLLIHLLMAACEAENGKNFAHTAEHMEAGICSRF